MKRYSLCIFVVLVHVLSPMAGLAEEPVRVLMSPEISDTRMTAMGDDAPRQQSLPASPQGQERKPPVDDTNYVQRSGRVQLAADMLIPTPQVKVGDRIALGLFADREFHMTVSAVVVRPTGIVTVTGRLDGHALDTVAMTVGAEGYMVSLTDHTEGMHYTASGVGDTLGTVISMRNEDRPSPRHSDAPVADTVYGQPEVER